MYETLLIYNIVKIYVYTYSSLNYTFLALNKLRIYVCFYNPSLH